jgi:hypothetical protein
MGKSDRRGGVPRSRKEKNAGANPEKGTGALGGFMPHPTGKVIIRAFGGDKQEPQEK